MIPRIFTVDGKPFFPLGGQARNSSGYNEAESERAFQAVKLLHGNMVEIPVYWQQVEPEEGQYDFTSVAALLASARRYDLRLVLLWFGTWKNGDMDYVPNWVKENPQHFRRVVSPAGRDVWGLSTFCPANMEADTRAFKALCDYLKENDADRRVIAIQIENEPGILGSDRDYSPAGQAVFNAPIPEELISRMKAAGKGTVYDLWQKAGGVEAGSWPVVFGPSGGELLSAWSIARYIDQIAEAGKAVYDIPMYINVWLGEVSWGIPGESYPSGGAVSKTLDIYKWFTPHIDLIAPDIYIGDTQNYCRVCDHYDRADNPLFIPESAPGSSNPLVMFYALGSYDAIGYSFFAAEQILDEAGKLKPDMHSLAGSFQAAAAAIPLLLKFQGTGRVHAIVQEENLGVQILPFEGVKCMAEFGEVSVSYPYKDWRHPSSAEVSVSSYGERGRGLVFQAGKKEFYLVGAAYRLVFRPDLPPERTLDASVYGSLLTRQTHYVSVDEGHFDEDGNYVVDRKRNGDEVDFGVWVEPDCGVLRVILCN